MFCAKRVVSEFLVTGLLHAFTNGSVFDWVYCVNRFNLVSLLCWLLTGPSNQPGITFVSISMHYCMHLNRQTNRQIGTRVDLTISLTISLRKSLGKSRGHFPDLCAKRVAS